MIGDNIDWTRMVPKTKILESWLKGGDNLDIANQESLGLELA